MFNNVTYFLAHQQAPFSHFLDEPQDESVQSAQMAIEMVSEINSAFTSICVLFIVLCF